MTYPVVCVAIAAAVSKWQELKLSGGLEGVEQEEEVDIYSEARMAEVLIYRSVWLTVWCVWL